MDHPALVTRPSEPTEWHPVVLFGVVAAAYAVGSQLAFTWFGADGATASFFPSAGVTFAALALVQRRQWSVVLVAAGLAEFGIDLFHDISVVAAFGYTVANLAQPVVGVAVLRRFGDRLNLAEGDSIWQFLVCGPMLAPVFGAAIGASVFVGVDGGSNWLKFALEWWVGDGLGILLVGGAVLAWSASSFGRVSRWETSGLVGAVVVSTAVVFRYDLFGLSSVPVALMMVTAARARTRATAIAVASAGIIAASFAAGGHRFWASSDVPDTTGLLYLQLALAVVFVATLLLAAAMNARDAVLATAVGDRAERLMSHALQRAMLGGELVAPPQCVVDSAYCAGEDQLEVGGDWYDLFALPNGHVAIVAGDVVGHGVSAAAAMSQLRGAVRALVPFCSPAQVLCALDDVVATTPDAHCTTVVVVDLDPLEGTMLYACAGHPPPLLVGDHEAPTFLWDGRSAPLGAQFGRERNEAIHRICSNDTIALYTDGLIERRGERLDDGLDRLAAAMASRAESHVAADIVAELAPPGSTTDDACLVLVRWVPARRMHASFAAKPAELATCRHAVRRWLRGLGVEGEDEDLALLAISEAAANATEHAYDAERPGTFEIDGELDGDDLILRVRDHGRWRDPVTPSGPHRGRGDTIMRAAMDAVEVRSDAGGTEVLMRRRLLPRLDDKESLKISTAG